MSLSANLSTLQYSTIQIVRPCDLSERDCQQWQQLRAAHAIFQSPYFDCEFVQAVSRVRSDVEIGVFRNEIGELVGVLPFQRTASNLAEPAGGRLNDLHGILGPPTNANSYLDFLRTAELDNFAFHAMADVGSDVTEYEFEKSSSYYVDLKNGYEDYWNWVKKHSSTIKRHGQKSRALARDLGSLEFEFDCRDSKWLEKLIDFKRARYQRTKTFDILSVEWAANLLREINQVSHNGFRGILSILRSEEKFIAGHFGMISNDILHYWFPVYDVQYSKYSPGTELFLQVARDASRSGIRKIDFGFGDDPYKTKVCDGREQVSCGQIRCDKAGFELARWKYHMRNRLKKIPMKPLVKTVLRKIYPGFGGWNFK